MRLSDDAYRELEALLGRTEGTALTAQLTGCLRVAEVETWVQQRNQPVVSRRALTFAVVFEETKRKTGMKRIMRRLRSQRLVPSDTPFTPTPYLVVLSAFVRQDEGEWRTVALAHQPQEFALRQYLSDCVQDNRRKLGPEVLESLDYAIRRLSNARRRARGDQLEPEDVELPRDRRAEPAEPGSGASSSLAWLHRALKGSRGSPEVAQLQDLLNLDSVTKWAGWVERSQGRNAADAKKARTVVLAAGVLRAARLEKNPDAVYLLLDGRKATRGHRAASAEDMAQALRLLIRPKERLEVRRADWVLAIAEHLQGAVADKRGASRSRYSALLTNVASAKGALRSSRDSHPTHSGVEQQAIQPAKRESSRISKGERLVVPTSTGGDPYARVRSITNDAERPSHVDIVGDCLERDRVRERTRTYPRSRRRTLDAMVELFDGASRGLGLHALSEELRGSGRPGPIEPSELVQQSEALELFLDFDADTTNLDFRGRTFAIELADFLEGGLSKRNSQAPSVLALKKRVQEVRAAEDRKGVDALSQRQKEASPRPPAQKKRGKVGNGMETAGNAFGRLHQSLQFSRRLTEANHALLHLLGEWMVRRWLRHYDDELTTREFENALLVASVILESAGRHGNPGRALKLLRSKGLAQNQSVGWVLQHSEAIEVLMSPEQDPRLLSEISQVQARKVAEYLSDVINLERSVDNDGPDYEALDARASEVLRLLGSSTPEDTEPHSSETPQPASSGRPSEKPRGDARDPKVKRREPAVRIGSGFGTLAAQDEGDREALERVFQSHVSAKPSDPTGREGSKLAKPSTAGQSANLRAAKPAPPPTREPAPKPGPNKQFWQATPMSQEHLVAALGLLVSVVAAKQEVGDPGLETLWGLLGFVGDGPESLEPSEAQLLNLGVSIARQVAFGEHVEKVEIGRAVAAITRVTSNMLGDPAVD